MKTHVLVHRSLQVLQNGCHQPPPRVKVSSKNCSIIKMCVCELASNHSVYQPACALATEIYLQQNGISIMQIAIMKPTKYYSDLKQYQHGSFIPRLQYGLEFSHVIFWMPSSNFIITKSYVTIKIVITMVN